MLDKFLALTPIDLVALLAAGLFGLLWHYLAKLIELRKSDHALSLRSYFADHLPETLASVMATVAGIAGLIYADAANLFTVALLAYNIDSHVNKWRSRSGLV